MYVKGLIGYVLKFQIDKDEFTFTLFFSEAKNYNFFTISLITRVNMENHFAIIKLKHVQKIQMKINFRF